MTSSASIASALLVEPSVTESGEVAAATTGERTNDGMRREWNFTVSLRHKAAAAYLQLLPMWKSIFIDAESAAPQLLAAAQHQAASAFGNASKRTPPPQVPLGTMIPWYAYEDSNSAIKALEEEGAGGGPASSPPRGGPGGTGATNTNDNVEDEYGMGEQLTKVVSSFYCPLPPYITADDSHFQSRRGVEAASIHPGTTQTSSNRHRESLEAFCKLSVQFVLQSDEHVASIDGETDLHKLCLGTKLNCKEKLGGSKSFSFRYTISDKKNLRHLHGYAIGTVVQGPVSNSAASPSDFLSGGATTASNLKAHAVDKIDYTTLPCLGYLTTITCAHEEELSVYVQSQFTRHFCSSSKLQLGRSDIVYKPCTYSVLAEQQLLYGELDYFDRDAALSFTIPMHPMNLRPDFSPIQTVGVGSVACMTAEVSVYQKLCDDNLEDEILGAGNHGGDTAPNNRVGSVVSIGSDARSEQGGQQGGTLPKHKANPVTLFLDVERVVKMGYPSVMSISHYAQLKAERLKSIFRNVTSIGEPLHIDLGPRPGRSTTVTFNYEGGTRGHANGSIKAMLVSTLVGNLGVTAVYFTPLGHGLFDAHLYLFQHLLRNITFFGERQLRSRFTRFTTQNFRLTEQDVGRLYSSAPPGERSAVDQHVKALQASTDGRVDSAKGMFVVNARTLVAVPATGFAPGTSVGGVAGAAAAAGGLTVEHRSMTADEEALSSATTQPGDSASQFDTTPIPVFSVPRLAAAGAQHITSDGEGVLHPQHQLEDGNSAVVDEDAGSTSISVPVAADASTKLTPPSDFDGAALQQDLDASDDDSEADDLLDDRQEVADDANRDVADGTLLAAVAREGSLNPEDNQDAADRELVNNILANDENNSYFGPSLRDVYVRCCETCGGCRPNSYLYNKLPLNSRFTNSVEELDLTSNYVGHQGFQAILNFIEHLPQLKILILDDMRLDNTDVKNLVETILDRPSLTAANQHTVVRPLSGASSSTSPSNNNNTMPLTTSLAPLQYNSLTRISLRNNAKITLPATKHLTRLLRQRPSIYILQLSGTSLGDSLVRRIEQEAFQNAPVPPRGAVPSTQVAVDVHPYQANTA